jgi:two-component system, LytTR family, response regulator
MSIRVLIVDDEPIARRGVRQRLRGEADIEVIGECGDGTSAIAAIGSLRPDLVILDIQMPELGGFEVLDAIGLSQMPAVIFVTAFDQFAVRAFDVHALDYVLKPIDGKRLGLALQRARQQLAQGDGQVAGRIAAALAELGVSGPRRWSKRLAIRSPNRIVLVDTSDISRIAAAGNYVEIHAGAKTHLQRESLESLQERLDPERFVRISRSSVVNIEWVREVQPMFNGDFVVILRDGTQVSGSRRYREMLSLLSA